MSFELTILGTSSATPTLERNPSAQALSFNQNLYLIDCGEGTQTQMLRYGVRSHKIERIFISHLHPDHCSGLIGLLSTMNLNRRGPELHIYGPPRLQEMIEIEFSCSEITMMYPIVYHHLEFDKIRVIFEDETITIRSIPLEHRINCCGFWFMEKKTAWKIDKTKIVGKNIPTPAFSVLKDGNDFIAEDGEVFYSKELTKPNVKPSSYVYISDTIYLENIAKQLFDVDVLYHEATFLDDLKDKAITTHHSTAKEAAQFASIAKAKQLILGHFSARYNDLTPILEEARATFPNTILAEEGKTYEIENKE